MSGLRCQICRRGQERSQARRNGSIIEVKSRPLSDGFSVFLRHFSVEPVGTTAVFAVGADLKTGVNVAGRWLFVPNSFATLRV